VLSLEGVPLEAIKKEAFFVEYPLEKKSFLNKQAKASVALCIV